MGKQKHNVQKPKRELLQSQVLKISKRRKLKLQLFQNWTILAGTKAIKNDDKYTSPNRSITFLKRVL